VAAGDLTTVEKARTHLAVKSTDADAVLAGLVASSSVWALGRVGGDLLSESYTETRDGNGRARMLLEHSHSWRPGRPPTEVSSVTVDGVTIPKRPAVSESSPSPSGWVYREDGIDLIGYTFSRGAQNVVIVYEAGFKGAETGNIPSTAPYQVQAQAVFRGDRGVTIAGAAATKVSANPAAGQYAVTDSGLYSFAAADAGKAVALGYAVVPGDVEQAVIEHVALRYRDRGREGLAAASGAGEGATFTATPGGLAFIHGVLERYRPTVVG
jgi:hypothetical protein